MFTKDLATVKKEPKSTTEVAAATRPHEESMGSKLVVGADIKLKGVEITDCDTLLVEGRVEASLDARLVQIAEPGVFTGAASMEVAEIHGRFEGELTARKHLIIYSTGRVSGTIRYGSLQVEEGGEISGDVNTLPRETAARPISADPKVSAYKPLSAPSATDIAATA